MNIMYKRVLLKISGEALAGEKPCGIDFKVVENTAKTIKECAEAGAQIAVVVGGGNFWRGKTSGSMNRVKADHMGMMATVMNAIALEDAFSQLGVNAKIMTAVPFPQVSEHYSPARAIHHLKKDRIVIFGYGTGNAFFSTDTAASLRAAEIQADAIFKATNTDGIYDSDPKTNPNAKKYTEVTFDEILSKNLKVMDSSAASMCRDNKIPVMVFNLGKSDNLLKTLQGENLGTIAKP
ncbi:MAG: UMP kinase [Clostridia bacterium]|nr:UMP kinase [Clostridia bacterium]